MCIYDLRFKKIKVIYFLGGAEKVKRKNYFNILKRLMHLWNYFQKLEREKLEKKSFKRRIEVLYEGFDIRCRLKRAYFLIYCIKRLLFVGLAFFFASESF